ncbi:MAG: DUF4249 family protein [Bacteroidales bacterium]|nr:DUF4249 family protein [Bacteroidales bacterium]
MKKHLTLFILAISFLMTSCIDDFKIDTENGKHLVGINAYFTNEYKKHQIVISKTTDFYSEDEAEMISGAEVFIHDGTDTIYFEETERKGYYETIDSVAGIVGKTYYLSVNIIDEDGLHNYYSQSKMRENISQIDSMAVKEIENTFANNFMENVNNTTTSLYPYFQSVDDPDVSYLINIIVNDTILKDNSFLSCNSISLNHLSGMYFNGTEMVSLVGEQSVHTFKTTQTYYDNDSTYVYDMNYYPIVEDGDKVTLCIYSVNPEFITYQTDIMSSFGSNPMMGMPYNVATNIYPGGTAVGFFEATSVTKGSIIY